MLAFGSLVRLVHNNVVLVGLTFHILLARCPKSQEILLENYFFRSSKSHPPAWYMFYYLRVLKCFNE